MLFAVAAMILSTSPFAPSNETAQVRFVTVSPAPEGRVDEVAFERASNRYALLAEGRNGAWLAQARLGEPDRFSPLQSSEMLPLPPGRYAVRRLGRGARVEHPPSPSEVLLRFEVRAGETYEVRCTAGGLSACEAATLSGVSRFL